MGSVVRTFTIATLGCVVATAASADVRRLGAVTVYTAPAQTAQAATIDYANAREMPLPGARSAPRSQAEALRLGGIPYRGSPRVSPGASGTGEERPIKLKAPLDLQDEGIEPAEFGTSNHPFSTSRVNVQQNLTSKFYPYRAAGKLFFNIGASTYLCSASLIKPGVVVTAAHCVAEFGQNQFYSNWSFVPAYNNGTAPYGTWTTSNAFVLTSYLNGTDSCAEPGIVCQNDVAVLVQNPQGSAYPGASTGFFGFGIDGFGFNASNLALINQLGYPASLDNGEQMQRNDSQSYADPTLSNNNVIGSLMTGGSSGGPWLVNLGIAPKLNGTAFGAESTHNTVVGVSSWGYTDTRFKEMGASPFTSTNINALVNTACTQVPAAC